MTCRTSILAAVLSLSLTACTVWAADTNEDNRITKVQERLETARSILAQTTNSTEKATWQDRVSLIEKELENVHRIVLLDQQEQASSTKRRQSPEHALREAISLIDTDVVNAEKEAKSLRGKIRSLKSARAELDKRNKQSDSKADTEDDSKQRAQREIKIQNLDAEILAAVYQREAAELQIRVARDAESIEAICATNTLNPRATLHLIFQKRQEVADSVKACGEYTRLTEGLEASRAQTADILNFSDQKFKHLDEDIASLRDGYKDSKKVRVSSDAREANQDYQLYLRTAMDVAESEKDLMEDRLKLLKVQIEALGRSISISEQGSALVEAQTAFLLHDLNVLKWSYFWMILIPITCIVVLCILFKLISRFLLPLCYHKDSLFLSRRMGRYILFMLITVVVVTFFLEDLRAIATVLGIVGAAIVIALQDLCSSFAGWFMIVASGKIKVGDRVEIDGKRGDVIDLQLMRITLVEINNWLGADEPTGRVVIIPNSFIFKSSVFNYAHVHPFIWDKADITVTYETPVKATYELLLRILTEETRNEFEEAARGEDNMEKQYGMKHAISGPRIDTIIGDNGVCFRLFYATHYKFICATRNKIMARILAEFEKDTDMQFAYPTRRQIQSVVPMPAPVIR